MHTDGLGIDTRQAAVDGFDHALTHQAQHALGFLGLTWLALSAYPKKSPYHIGKGLLLAGGAIELAQSLADKPGIAVGLTKRLLIQATRNSLADQLEAETEMQSIASNDPARAKAREAMLAKLSR